MDAVDRGEAVSWNRRRHPVHKGHLGRYFVGEGPEMIGLTWADDVSTNAKPEEFLVLTRTEPSGTHDMALH